MLWLGHRGHRRPQWQEQENSLAAFDRALACGCHGLEMDLRLTADGRVVIHHDPELRCGRQVLPLAQYSWRRLRCSNADLVTLETVLRRYRNRAWMDLELKTIEAVAPAVHALARYPPQRGFVISCFDAAVLRQLARLAPELPRCLNLERPCSLARIREASVDWVAPRESACTPGFVQRLQLHGWQVLVWTVNRQTRMRQLVRAGVDAICSDYPDLLVRTLAGSACRATEIAVPASFIKNEHCGSRHSTAGGKPGRMVPES